MAGRIAHPAKKQPDTATTAPRWMDERCIINEKSMPGTSQSMDTLINS